MTTQEAYERIRKFFVEDAIGYAAIPDPDGEDGETTCVYRGDGDASSPLRCAVGCLIPDNLYDPNYEARIVSDILQDPPLAAYFGDVNHAFLRAAQRAHDLRSDSPDFSLDDFVRALDKIALDFGLTVPAAA